MAFTTYANLTANIATWLARSDLTDNIPDFITLFEAHAARKLRVRPMETAVTLVTSAGSVALPSGYLGFKRVTWLGSTQVELTYKHPTMLKALYPAGASGTPADFTIEGSTLKVRPIDDTGVELLYFAKNAALSSALNWLYNNHPDAFLFGAMCEAKLFLEDFEGAALWKSRRDEVLDEIKLLNFREPGALQMQVYGQTP
jgi:hypothetical protein